MTELNHPREQQAERQRQKELETAISQAAPPPKGNAGIAAAELAKKKGWEKAEADRLEAAHREDIEPPSTDKPISDKALRARRAIAHRKDGYPEATARLIAQREAVEGED